MSVKVTYKGLTVHYEYPSGVQEVAKGVDPYCRGGQYEQWLSSCFGAFGDWSGVGSLLLVDGQGDAQVGERFGDDKGTTSGVEDLLGCRCDAQCDDLSVGDLSRLEGCYGGRVGGCGCNVTVGSDGGSRVCGVFDGVPIKDGSVGSGVSVKKALGKKSKMGKNERDRAKRSKARDWRENAGPIKSDSAVVEERVAKEGKCQVVCEKSVARVSLEAKWDLENQVAIEKAKKDLEFQRARDVDAEARKSRAKIMKETESSKVATEKAYAFLKSTGNVPGFCETVVSGGVESGDGVPGLSNGASPDCTISPDSSASMHEFRKCQKELEDLKFEHAKVKRQLEYGKLAAGEEAAFTINSDNDVSESVKEVIKKNTTDYYDVEIRDDSYGQDRAYTMYAKRISIPGVDEFSFDY